MKDIRKFLSETAHTCGSLYNALLDWIQLRTSRRDKVLQRTFAFLVHPRTDVFTGSDVYGQNDIYRPFPAIRYLFKVLPQGVAEKIILLFAKTIVPITLSRISVNADSGSIEGYLLSTVRTPRLLYGLGKEQTREHLGSLFDLAGKWGVARVGLGALLPSLTGYGRHLAETKPLVKRPAVSTGHAYTAYTITQYLELFVSRRNRGCSSVRVAVVGAGGSTGKALLRVLKIVWKSKVRLELLLVDVPKKESSLELAAEEIRAHGRSVAEVRVSTDLASLRQVEYVVVVTNASGAVIRPEHVRPGTIIIDDSQPRNTSPELMEHGCHVIDVLARIVGLDCHFDFGFKTDDHTVTFTCLAETILAAAAGCSDDLAVGEVTDDVVERMLEIVRVGKRLGLVGPLPFFSFGREMTEGEREQILRRSAARKSHSLAA